MLAAQWLATATEAISAAIIGIGIINAAGLTAAYCLSQVRPGRPAAIDARETIRLKLGRWLALALEFQLAADILKTAVAPTWDDVGKVAAIILLRTMLNFFLAREIAATERQVADHSART